MSAKSRLSHVSTTKRSEVGDNPPAYKEHWDHRLGSSASPVTSAISLQESGIQWGVKRACIMLNRTDLLQMVGFPVDAAERVDGIVRIEWKKGVQKQKYHEGCWEWKLSGRPWLGQFKDAIPSRHLVLAILTELWMMGWTLETSQPVFLYSENRDTMFFKQVLPRPTIARQFFAVGIAESDKLRVYNCPSDEVDKVVGYILRRYPGGLQGETEKGIGYKQYKLRGMPWLSYDLVQYVNGRNLICDLLSALEGAGYNLLGSVDMTVGNDSRDGDTMFFGSRV